MTSTTALMTFAEFEQMPEAPGKQELIDGELIEMPPAKVIHMEVSERVFIHLRSGTAGTRAHIEWGYRIGGGWLQPDVSVARQGQEVCGGYAMGSPELAVEVLSPANRKSRIERKIALFRRRRGRSVGDRSFQKNDNGLPLQSGRLTPNCSTRSARVEIRLDAACGVVRG